MICWIDINFIYCKISFVLDCIFLFLNFLFRDFHRLYCFLWNFIAFNLFNGFYFVFQDFWDYKFRPIVFNSYWIAFNLLDFRHHIFLINFWLFFKLIINFLNRYFFFFSRFIFKLNCYIFLRITYVIYFKFVLFWMWFIFKSTVFNPDFISVLVLSLFNYFLFSFPKNLFFFFYNLLLISLFLFLIFLNFHLIVDLLLFNRFFNFFLFFLSFLFLFQWIWFNWFNYLLYVFFFNSYSCIYFNWLSLFNDYGFFLYYFWFNWNLFLLFNLFFLV